jgi:hypothetical protein
MTLDPELTAILAAALAGALVGTPAIGRAIRRRRRKLGACLGCGRTVIFGSKTCDCG